MHGWFPSLSQHLLWIAASLLVYIVSTRFGQIRRPPASAIAWVIGLVLVPYVWLPLFILFGRRKLKVAAVGGAPPEPCADAHWAAQLLSSFGLPPPAEGVVRFHANGQEALDALWQIIESAQHRLDVGTFLVADDALGRELIGRLARRAGEGVRVRLLVDGAGVWFARHPSFRRLREAGGQVALFHPLLSLHPHGSRNLRSHRKLVLADDARLWSGGRNFAAEYFCGEGPQAQPWIDLSFDLRGATAEIAGRQFQMDWTHRHGKLQRGTVCGGSTGAPAATQFLPSGPDQAEDTALGLLVAACYRARHQVLVVTPYFVPDESLLTALRLAARRGIRVMIVLPQISNHRMADFVRSRALRMLAAAGARISLVPQMVHAKAVVVDQDLALCGSVNLDVRSLLLNYESAVVFYGVAEINWLNEWIETLAAVGTPWRNSPVSLWRDVTEGVVLAFAFQL